MKLHFYIKNREIGLRVKYLEVRPEGGSLGMRWVVFLHKNIYFAVVNLKTSQTEHKVILNRLFLLYLLTFKFEIQTFWPFHTKVQ